MSAQPDSSSTTTSTTGKTVAPDAKERLLSLFKVAVEKRVRMEKLKKLVEAKKLQLGDNYKEFDSPFVPSDNIGEHIITLAQITKEDVFVDVGCGDGRVLLEVYEKVPCKCIGIEIDPILVEKARARIPSNLLQSSAIEIILCDFKSPQATLILQKATVVYLYLLPKIMPVVTDILSKNLPSKARICSHTFPLRTMLRQRRVEVKDWPFMTLGIKIEHIPKKDQVTLWNKWNEWRSSQRMPKLELPTIINTDIWNEYAIDHEEEIIMVTSLHPLLKSEYLIETNALLMEIGECSIPQILSNCVGSKVEHIQRYIHAYLSDCQRFSKSARFVFRNPPIESFYKPAKIFEINKTIKTTTMNSDLMLYITPLQDKDLGWTPPTAAVRIT